MKQRIISAIFMFIILIPIFVIGGNIFTIAVSMISVLALKELIDLKESHHEIPDTVFLISIIDLLFLILFECDGVSLSLGLTYKGIAITCISLLLPVLFYKKVKYDTKDAFYLIGITLFLGVIFNTILLIRNIDINHFIYLLLIVILTDTFALFIGKLIGKHKSCPTISPNKTWEGCIGGALVGTVISLIFYLNVISSSHVLLVGIMSLVLSIMGQMGDLIFSKIKRENKIKDFSNLIPGHGGILDRMDSFIFVVLTYIILFEII